MDHGMRGVREYDGPMNCRQVLKELESLGSAQTRKTYARHGLNGPMFGVKYGDLNRLQKKLKGRHELAFELWDSGNLDARILATKVFDPKRIRAKDLTALMKDVDSHGLSSALSNVAQRSDAAKSIMHLWMSRKGELASNAGWMMLAGITRERPDLFTRKEYSEFLKTIEARIHEAPNQTRHAMNLALIGIGTYIDEQKAIRCAKRIGVVEVDHGDTSCKTPSAATYIMKAAAHHRAKLDRRA
jgi:3-methyladenine DNA glycosylase AlkD